jgi:hypothetical protein
MRSNVNAWRVLAKGVSLFAIIELILAVMHPTLGGWTIYNAAQKRQRLPTSTHPPEDAALEIGDLDTLLASHLVSEPKPQDEFRVLVLGDSAVWGFLLELDETLPGQLNAAGLHACSGKSIRFYNLSYPFASVTKDLMILDKAMQYQPDMILWTISLYTVMPKSRIVHWLIPQNPDEIDKLEARFHFLPRNYEFLNSWGRFLLQQRKLMHILRFQLASLIPIATGRDQLYPKAYQIIPTELTRERNFEGMAPPTVHPKQLAIDEIQDGYDLSAGLPVLLVNEPILIVRDAPNSEIRYNGYYPRWVYDQYRQQMAAAVAQNRWDYLDLWDMFPAEYFTNTPLHLNAEGERQLAAALLPSIERLACP